MPNACFCRTFTRANTRILSKPRSHWRLLFKIDIITYCNEVVKLSDSVTSLSAKSRAIVAASQMVSEPPESAIQAVADVTSLPRDAAIKWLKVRY